MQRLKRLVPLAAVLTIMAAPGAITPAFAQGSPQQQTAQTRMGATSPATMLSHAYQEALHAHESAALGMNDMATNHLENVRLTLAMIDPQASGMNQSVQQQLAAIRELVESVDLPSDRNQAVQSTERLVNQFVTLFNRMPQGMGGGGGAAQQAMQPTVFDITVLASADAANAHTSAVRRDWEKVQRHAQDAVSHLDQAIKSAESGTHKLDASLVRELRSIRQDASQLLTHAKNKNASTNEAAGKLVTRLGAISPKIAMSHQQRGGGAGQPRK